MKISIVHKLSITTVALVLFSIAIVSWVFYSKTSAVLVDETLDDISISIRNAGIRIQDHIEVQNEDVLFLAGMPPIQGILRAKNKARYDQSDKSTYQQWVKRQQSIFIEMLKTKPEYLKLRFIDKNGQEQIVVGREGDEIVALSGEQLQNKAHRKYFIETLKLSKGSVYLSEINLNREHGKVSEPYAEVLRSSAPVYNDVTGEVAGILLITAEVGHELREIQNELQSVSSNIYITNDHGGYLLHPDSNKTYGFDLGKHYRIQEEIPLLAKLFLPDNKDDNIILQPKDIGGKDVINFTKIHFDIVHPERFITIGIAELYSSITAKQAGVLTDVIWITLVLAIIVTLLAILFSFRLSRPIKQITQAVDDFTHERETNAIMPIHLNDEVGVLAHSFDSMIVQIEEAQLSLKDANKNLESRVAERTLALEVSEARQRAVLETVADAIITISDKGLITGFNPAAEKTFGYTTAEVIGNNVSFLLPKEERQAHEAYTDNSKLNASRIINERRDLEGLRKDGSIFPLELNVAPMNIEGERGFVGILRDITERNSAEQEIRRFKTTLDETMDCVFMFEPDTLKFFYVNAGAMNQVGYSSEEMLDKTAFDIKPEFDEKRFREAIAPMIAGEESIINFETLHEHKDGHTIPVEVFLQYIAPFGESPRFVAIVRDITERKQMDKMKNEFISTVSHELRTPLTSIRGSLGLLSSGTVGELPESANDMLKIASNNTERLLLLINDILDIQKIESGKMSFKFESIDLPSFIEQAITDHAEYGKQHGVTFVFENVLEGVRVFADKDRLMQVMGNLLSNAAKFSNDGDNVEISVASHQSDRLRISVTDYGAGIPEEFQPKLFDRFTQSDSSDTRTKGGTGLGLSIVKVIIEKHGGLIDFISKEGIGSTFYIELPELMGEVKAADSAIYSLSDDTSACVLIVEDDPDVAALIRRMLAEAGFNSDIAYDAKQARQLLAKRKCYYRLMTLDISLPDEDGISLLASLRKNPETKDLPVVVLSVKVNEAKRELKGGALDVADWLSKPIDSQRLVDVVTNVVTANQRPRVLHVEDEKDVHTVVKKMLDGKCELLWTTTVAESRELQPQVVIFSALDVSEKYANRVDAVLVKSKTNNEKLLKTLVGAMK